MYYKDGARLGNIYAPGKCKAYSPTEISAGHKIELEKIGVEVISPEQGIVTGGCPIGSDQFCESYYNKKVEELP